MSAPNVRQKIFDAIRLEVRDVLQDADGPLVAGVIHDRCPTSADAGDIWPVLKRMENDGEIRRSKSANGMVKFAAVYAARASRNATQAGRRPPGQTGQRVIDSIAQAGEWLTVEELEQRLDLSHEQIRNVVKQSKRLTSRPRTDAKSGAHEYGLTEWAAEAVATDAPSADAESAPTAATEPGEARLAHRFGLWSDGTLAIETAAGELDLPPAITHDLIAYLIRERAQVTHLFDTELEVSDA